MTRVSGTIDQLRGLTEVKGRDRERAERRTHDELDLILISSDVVDEALFDQERQGVHRGGQRRPGGPLERTCGTRGQNDDSVRAKGDRLADGGVVRDAAVEEHAPVDLDGGEHGGNGGGSEDGGSGLTGREEDLGARQHSGRDDVDRQGGSLEIVVVEVLVDETAQTS